MPEVRNATGYQRQARSADAISVSTYPSRGIRVHGFEIKVSKSDWRRELANPDKAEEIAQYCDHWWIVAPPDVVDLDDLPKDWGLLVAKSNGLHKLKAAPQLLAETLDRRFLVSMLRSAHTLVEAAERRSPAKVAIDDAWQEGYEKGKAQRAKERGRRLEQLQALEKRVREFKERSGINLDSFRPLAEQADALKLAEELVRNRRTLRTLHGAIGEFLEGPR